MFSQFLQISSSEAKSSGLHPTNNKFPEFRVDNDLARARAEHLVELLFLRDFDPKINNPKKYYKNLFMEEFKHRRAKVDGMEFEIWARAFDNSELKGNLEKWVEMWVNKRQMSEEEWYKTHYSEFYYKTYKPYIRRIKTTIPEFWFWYENDYKSMNKYPSLN